MNSCYSNRVTEQAKSKKLKDNHQEIKMNYLTFYSLLFIFYFLLLSSESCRKAIEPQQILVSFPL